MVCHQLINLVSVEIPFPSTPYKVLRLKNHSNIYKMYLSSSRSKIKHLNPIRSNVQATHFTDSVPCFLLNS